VDLQSLYEIRQKIGSGTYGEVYAATLRVDPTRRVAEDERPSGPALAGAVA
jgi:serine/threonine protein kinase